MRSALPYLVEQHLDRLVRIGFISHVTLDAATLQTLVKKRTHSGSDHHMHVV